MLKTTNSRQAMFTVRGFTFGMFLLMGVLASVGTVWAETAETVVAVVDVNTPIAPISGDAVGLSYETSRMLPDEHGVHYFRADNLPLVTTFNTLGVKSLRIGGNAVDDEKVAIPSPDDVISLFEFAKVAEVKVIYSVRFKNGDPASAAIQAKIIGERYPQVIDCFAIGNEPYYYQKKSAGEYVPKWTAIHDAIIAVFPAARFCGPDQNPDPELGRKVIETVGKNPDFCLLTHHSYPFGCSYENPKVTLTAKTIEEMYAALKPKNAAVSREKMLAPAAYATYEKIHKGFMDALAGTTISFRLSETNSYWCSGLNGASNSFAAAIWSADYLHWWTAHGAKGANFHTGDRTGGARSMTCHYAAFVSSANGYEARPLAYGMKLFDLGGHGRRLPVTLPQASTAQLAVYAALDNDGNVLVTIINKAHGVQNKEIPFTLRLSGGRTIKQAQSILLCTPTGDIAEMKKITLGGCPIAEDGTWHGDWTTRPLSTAGQGDMTVNVPPLSAMVVKLRLN